MGAVIIMICFAVRACFGVFQPPIAGKFGWLQTEFSRAIAIRNLASGIGVAIGAFSAIDHLPIRQQPLAAYPRDRRIASST